MEKELWVMFVSGGEGNGRGQTGGRCQQWGPGLAGAHCRIKESALLSHFLLNGDKFPNFGYFHRSLEGVLSPSADGAEQISLNTQWSLAPLTFNCYNLGLFCSFPDANKSSPILVSKGSSCLMEVT